MTIVHQVKTNFTAGEIAPRLLGRGDLRAFANGALALRNLFIHPTGGVTRRSGLRFVARARGAGRLIAFEIAADRTYLLALSAGLIDVYQGDTHLATVPSPWTVAQIAQLAWTQNADTLLLCHPDVPPRTLTRYSDSDWRLAVWSFATSGDVRLEPFHRFAPSDVTVTPSGTSNTITVTASASVFDPLMEGARLRIGGKQVVVTGVASSAQLTASVVETLSGTNATTAWDEPAFSARRGWPVAVAFHQGRLVIGGSRDLPNRLWMSQSGDIWNFDVGEGYDAEAIDFAILSDQVNAVRAVFSGRDLQVFTSGGEYVVSGSPLTPTSIQVERQTRIGSPVDRSVAPRDVDGATLFVSRNGRELREFLYTDSEDAYLATDLALLANHLVDAPSDLDYDQGRRILLVVMADGTLGALTLYRAEGVTAWTSLTTEGSFRSVSVVGDTDYVLVERGTVWTIERFDDGLGLDSAMTGTHGDATLVWTGLGHLEGRTVAVVADGAVADDAVVAAGAITLDTAATSVQAGLLFSHIVEPLPPTQLGQGAAGNRVRLIDVSFRLLETAALRVDVGRGLTDLPLHRFGPQPADGAAPDPVTGDRVIRALGWRRDIDAPLWRIEQDTPLPFTLLSATMNLKVND